MTTSFRIILVLFGILAFISCERQSRDYAGSTASPVRTTQDIEASPFGLPIQTAANMAVKDTGSAVIDGQALYVANCAACHQVTGQGIPGAFPTLVDTSWVLGDPSKMVAIMLYGLQGPIEVKGVTYNSIMTPFKHLKNEELAAIASYVRTSWGNKADPVTPDLVETTRSKWGDRGMLTVTDLDG